MKTGQRITEVYAYICLDQKDDCEGIPAFTAPHPDGTDAAMFVPMVGADKERMESLMPLARDMVRKTKKPMRLVKFTTIHELGPVVDIEEETDRA